MRPENTVKSHETEHYRPPSYPIGGKAKNAEIDRLREENAAMRERVDELKEHTTPTAPTVARPGRPSLWRKMDKTLGGVDEGYWRNGANGFASIEITHHPSMRDQHVVRIVPNDGSGIRTTVWSWHEAVDWANEHADRIGGWAQADAAEPEPEPEPDADPTLAMTVAQRDRLLATVREIAVEMGADPDESGGLFFFGGADQRKLVFHVFPGGPGKGDA